MVEPDDNEVEDFAAIFEASERESGSRAAPELVAGEVITGTVVSISSESVFVGLGGKSEGVLEASQVTDEDGNLTVAVGDSIRAHIVDAGETTGVAILRCKLGRGVQALGELQVAFDNGIPVEGLVQAVNQGGFDVQVAGLRAFCPISQMDVRFVENPETFIGRREEFRITRFEDDGRGVPNIVLSRRSLLEEEIEARQQATRSIMSVGSVFRGTVRSIQDYGAFIDIGGVEGMLHISEMSYVRVAHPSEVLEEGQEVDVQIVKIEATDNPRRPEKIGLSMKALLKDPFSSVVKDFPVGRRVPGKVTRVEQYGAFVEIAPGIEGLVHISEMGGGQRLSSPRKVVSEGQEVMVAVLSTDLAQRRISLSMDAAGRAAEAEEERAAIEAYSPGGEGFGTLGDLLAGSLKKKQ